MADDRGSKPPHGCAPCCAPGARACVRAACVRAACVRACVRAARGRMAAPCPFFLAALSAVEQTPGPLRCGSRLASLPPLRRRELHFQGLSRLRGRRRIGPRLWRLHGPVRHHEWPQGASTPARAHAHMHTQCAHVHARCALARTHLCILNTPSPSDPPLAPHPLPFSRSQHRWRRMRRQRRRRSRPFIRPEPRPWAWGAPLRS